MAPGLRKKLTTTCIPIFHSNASVSTIVINNHEKKILLYFQCHSVEKNKRQTKFPRTVNIS